MITSSNPTAERWLGRSPTWTVSTTFHTWQASPCPSDSLSIAGDQNSHALAASTNPLVARVWTVTKVDDSQRDPRRLRLHWCFPVPLAASVAVDSRGQREDFTSTNPAGGAAAWKVTHVD